MENFCLNLRNFGYLASNKVFSFFMSQLTFLNLAQNTLMLETTGFRLVLSLLPWKHGDYGKGFGSFRGRMQFFIWQPPGCSIFILEQN